MCIRDSHSPQDWWRHELLHEGRRLVPLLLRLAEAGQAVRWLAALDAVEVESAAASLAGDYGLVLSPIVRGDGLSFGDRSARIAVHPDSATIRQEEAAVATVRAARDAIVARGEPVAVLPAAARALLVAAVILARAPSIPRAALARAIACEAGEVHFSAPSTRRAAAASAGEHLDEAVASGPATTAPASSIPVIGPPRRPTIIPVERKKTEAPAIVADRAPAARADSLAARPERSPPALPPAPEAARQPFVEPPTSAVPLSPPRETFDTAFGGLAFLLNAFLAMGLYPDFTRPLDPGVPVAPLALIDRLGGHWFGARYRRDPLHGWIVRRGRQGALPRRWRVEADWLIPFAPGQCWHDGSTLWHAAGFPIANRIAPAPAQRLARRLDLPMRTRPRQGANPAWLHCLALFLAARFRRAAADGALTPETLAIPARAVIGEARIDVHIALAALPIALRLAGLDRDPGWLPAEGRDVRFHFE